MARFVAALESADGTQLADLVQFPVSFAGHMLGAGQVDHLRVALVFARAAGDAWRLRELHQGS